MDKPDVGKSVILLIAAVVTAIQGFYALAAITGVLGIGLLSWTILRRSRDQAAKDGPAAE